MKIERNLARQISYGGKLLELRDSSLWNRAIY